MFIPVKMKETQSINKDQVNIVKQVQLKKETHIGTICPQPGHTIFEFNKVTKEIRKAKFENAAYQFLKNSVHNKRVNVKENCYYLSSLNEKNAVKKIHKLFNVPYVIAINE